MLSHSFGSGKDASSVLGWWLEKLDSMKPYWLVSRESDRTGQGMEVWWESGSICRRKLEQHLGRFLTHKVLLHQTCGVTVGSWWGYRQPSGIR